MPPDNPSKGSPQDWLDHATSDLELARIGISVEFVIDLLARGWSTKQILDEYKHLEEDDVQACLAYVDDCR